MFLTIFFVNHLTAELCALGQQGYVIILVTVLSLFGCVLKFSNVARSVILTRYCHY